MFYSSYVFWKFSVYFRITVYVRSTSYDRILDDDAARSRRRSRGQLVNRFDNRDRDLWLRTIPRSRGGSSSSSTRHSLFPHCGRIEWILKMRFARFTDWKLMERTVERERERGIWRDFISFLLWNCVLFSINVGNLEKKAFCTFCFFFFFLFGSCNSMFLWL